MTDALFVRRFAGEISGRAEHADHDHFTLALWLAGTGVFEMNGARSAVESGTVQLVPAGMMHRLVSARSAEVLALGFCATCWRLDPSLLLPFDRVRRGAAFAFACDDERRAEVAHLLTRLERELRGEGAELVSQSLLTLILAEVGRAHRASGDAPGAHALPTAVADALAFVERHGLEPQLGLRDVAAAVGVSAAHLTTTVRRSTGRTVQQWITLGRIHEAQRLLSQTSLGVDAIATRVGYADARHFRRAFKQHAGVSPAAWRTSERGRSSPSSP